jgi:hypothetical protein
VAAARRPATGCPASSRRRRPGGHDRQRTDRDDHRAGSVVADRVVHADRQGLRGRQPGYDGDVLLRRQRTARHADHLGRTGRCLRRRQRRDHEDVIDAGDAAGTPTVFFRNQLVIAVPKGNPERIAALADLTLPGLKVALCTEQVPCGAAAKKALEAAGTKLTPVTLEQEVKQALSKVKLGEVDAALVYRTDVKASAADVEGDRVPRVRGRHQRLPDRRAEERPQRRGCERVRRVRAHRRRRCGTHRRRLPEALTVFPAKAPARSRTRRRATGRIPIVLAVPALLGLAFLVLPLAGLLIRAPWTTMPRRLAAPGVLDALRLSLLTATLATVVCLLLGVPLAWLLARATFPGRRVVRALVTVPLVLPPVVGGVALLLVLGRGG